MLQPRDRFGVSLAPDLVINFLEVILLLQPPPRDIGDAQSRGGLIAAGACLRIGLVGLVGRLKIREE